MIYRYPRDSSLPSNMFLALVVLAVLSLLVSGVLCGPSMNGLRVVGNQIRNGDGQVVYIRGVNRPGFEYMCVQNTGKTNDGPIDQASVNAMLSWNINTVRIPMNEQCWLNINNANPAGATYINALRAYVDLLTANNLAVILDLHWTATGNALADRQAAMPNSDHSVAFWTAVATAFSSYTNVILDLFNEPYPCFNFGSCPSYYQCDSGVPSSTWSCWKNGGSSCPGFEWAVGMQTLVNTVRATGAPNIILLNGIMYGGCLNGWLANKPTDTLNNIAAGSHHYDHSTCHDSACWDNYIGPLASQYPVILGEVGQQDCGTGFTESIMNWADARGVGYLAWGWYIAQCNSPSLITDFITANPTSNGLGFKNHLRNFNGSSPCSSNCPSTTTTGSGSSGGPVSGSCTSTPGCSGNSLVYTDGIQNSFDDWSWSGTTYSLTATNRVRTGSRAISFTPTAAYVAVYFHKVGAIDTSRYQGIEFYVFGSSENRVTFNVVTGQAGTKIGTYSLTIQSGSWTRNYADLTTIPAGMYDGIWFQNDGTAQPALYIDDITLVACGCGSSSTTTTTTTTLSSSAAAATRATSSAAATTTRTTSSSSSSSLTTGGAIGSSTVSTSSSPASSVSSVSSTSSSNVVLSLNAVVDASSVSTILSGSILNSTSTISGLTSSTTGSTVSNTGGLPINLISPACPKVQPPTRIGVIFLMMAMVMIAVGF